MLVKPDTDSAFFRIVIDSLQLPSDTTSYF